MRTREVADAPTARLPSDERPMPRGRRSAGGPTSRSGSVRAGDLWFETDSRKRVSLNAETFYESTEYGGWSLGEWMRVNVKPSSSLSLSPVLLSSRPTSSLCNPFTMHQAIMLVVSAP